MKRFLTIFLIAFIGLGFVAEHASAIPAFGRKYRMSCKTCHSPIPRLKAYGDDFAGNGFVLTDSDAPRYYVDAGDDELSLISEFPLAVRFDGFLSYNNSNTEKSDLASPYTLKLMSGGEFAPNIAYYFYFYMSERGEIAGVEDAYVMFNDLFGIDWDIYFGQFQVSDPLFKRELRLTLEDYEIYKSKSDLSRMNLAYDRGIMTTLGLDTGTDIIFEVINGCGLNEADATKVFDIDKHKNFVGRVSQDIFDFARIGVFAYMGKEEYNPEETGALYKNEMNMFGADMTLSYDDVLELNLQYLTRNDDVSGSDTAILPTDLENPDKLKTSGGLAELIFMPDGDDSKWYLAALANYVDASENELVEDYKSATFHAGYMLRRNIRLVLEGTHNFSNSDETFTAFSLGIVSAF